MLNGLDFVKRLPKDASPARDKAILDAIRKGEHFPITWQAVPLRPHEGHTGIVFVTQDAIKVGREDPVRIAMTAPGAQRVANELGALLPTTEIIDTAWRHSLDDGIAFDAITGPSDATMDDTAVMLEHDREIERVRAGRMGLLVNSGKHWALTNKLITSPGRAANYGFFSSRGKYRTLSGLQCWQPLSTAHTYPPSSSDTDMGGQCDYSQKLWLMLGELVVDGRLRPFAEVASDPELAPLVSSEGILRVLRYPAVSVDGLTPPLPFPDSTSLTFSRVLELGSPYMSGPDVAAWQRFVRVTADGKFGPITRGVTAEWQRLHMTGGFSPGVVDKRTVEAANEHLAGRVLGGGYEFVQARSYTKANRAPGDVYWIVVHTMEAAEKPTTAEACAKYFATTTRDASAHYCIDNDSIVQCVRLEDVAHGAPGANKYGIHLEHAGYARQTPDEWADDFSREMLGLSAGLTKELARDWNIPVRFVDTEMLKEAKKRYDRGEVVPPELCGITTHHETSKAWKQSTHTDPGKDFPMQDYLDAVA